MVISSEVSSYISQPKTPLNTDTQGRVGENIQITKEYRIEGDDFQNLVMTLRPGEKILIDPESLVYRDDGIHLEARAPGGVSDAIKRMVGGENLFVPELVNTAHLNKDVTLAGMHPGKILPMNLSNYGKDGFMFQRGSYLASKGDVKIDISFPGFAQAFLGGEGMFLQRLEGTGEVFIHSGGNLIARELAPGEKIRVNTGNLIGFQPTVRFDVEPVKGLKNMLLGGQGLFDSVLTGPGKVLIQSLPLSRLAENLSRPRNSESGLGSAIFQSALEVLASQ